MADVFVIFNLGHAAIAARYFIITPNVFDMAVAALLGAAVPALARSSPVNAT